jgi:hypothetical protein
MTAVIAAAAAIANMSGAIAMTEMIPTVYIYIDSVILRRIADYIS